MKSDNVKRYMNTYTGKKLVTEHRPDEYGLWRILGEDPNCDLGGHHHQPELALVEGKLEDIIAYAVDLKGFWQWGSGGDIRRVGKPVKVDANTNAERVRLEQEALALKEKLRALNDQIESMGGNPVV